MREMTIIVDTAQGALAVENNADLNLDALVNLTEQFGAAQPIACARPLEIITPQPASAEELATDVCVRVNGFYHNSLTEGPGRRSSVLFQFCPLKCKGCYVPHLHGAAGGAMISVKRLADLLLDEMHERDGVTILGGEPFAQAPGLFALVKELRSKNCPHIVCYSGYTLKALREKAIIQPSIGEMLNEIDVLIDGAYVESLASLARKLEKLKNEYGKDITVESGLKLWQTFVQNSLFDVICCQIHPVIAGDGEKLFDDRFKKCLCNSAKPKFLITESFR